MAQPYFPIPQIICAAIVLAVMLFFPNLLKKPYLLLACGALVIVSLLVLASTVIVWFGA